MKIYHTETQADYDSLMVELEEQGVKWRAGTNPTEANNWSEFKRQTGIKLQDCILTYRDVEYFERENPETPIIKYTAKKETQLPEWANWLARDKDGVLYAFEKKPLKSEIAWYIIGDDDVYRIMSETDDTFSHIKWTDEEPTPVNKSLHKGGKTEMKEDIKWLKENLQTMINQEYRCYDPLIQQTKPTCRIIMDLIDQLDGPQKPVIPQFVADYIEKWKHKGLTIYEWFTFGNNDMDEDIDKWLYNNTVEENRKREYLLIDAIRNGYEVEKEKLYHVVNEENYFMLRKDDGLVLSMQVSPAMSRKEFGKDPRFMLTKKEIKNYDKRYWAFRKPVEELGK